MQSIKEMKQEKRLDQIAEALTIGFGSEIERIAASHGATGQELAVRLTARLCDFFKIPGQPAN